MASLKRRDVALSPPSSPLKLAKCAVSADGSPARKWAPASRCGVVALQKALSVDFPEAGLVDRAIQATKLTDFITSHVERRQGGSLYVCGAPGTGKSATTVSCCVDFRGNGAFAV